MKIIDTNTCGGSLFEHMDGFEKPENSKYIGNGIKFLGSYMRVQPYSEIKESLLMVINNYISNRNE